MKSEGDNLAGRVKINQRTTSNFGNRRSQSLQERVRFGGSGLHMGVNVKMRFTASASVS